MSSLHPTEIEANNDRERLELALEAASLSSWDWHYDTGEVDISELWWRTLGYPPSAQGERLEYWLKFTHPDDHPRMREALKAHRDGRAPTFDVEYRMRAQNGAWRWIRTVGKITAQDNAGRAIRLSGFHQDVTTRMQVREALQDLVDAGARDRGTRYSAYISQRLAGILEVDFAFVALRTDEQKDRIRTLAWRVDGSLADNMEFSVLGTPCAEVLEGQPVTVTQDVQAAFPGDEVLAELGVASYCAVPLINTVDRVFGLVGIMSREPIVDTQHVEHVVQLFGGAVAAEILRERSEQQFHGLFDASADAMIMIDEGGVIRLANRAAEKGFGYSASGLIGQPMALLMAESTREKLVPRWQTFFERAKTHTISSGELAFEGRRRDGSEFATEFNLTPLRTEFGTTVMATIRDITKRQQQEEKIRRLSRIHTLLSGINSMIVRVRNREELFKEACRIAVTEGGFAFAWIGLAEPGATKVAPAALAGAQGGYLDDVGKELAKVTDDPGIAGVVLREQRAVIANNIENDPQVMFKDEALKHGFQAVAAFPLTESGGVIGTFVFYSADTDVFNPVEVSLLTELAGDISFAIDGISKDRQLNFLAYYDPLTKLPNQTLMQDRSEQILRNLKQGSLPCALIFLDIDRFRNVNASLGRAAGDKLLQRVAADLVAALPADSNVARLNSDCFAILANDIKDAPAAGRLFEDVIAPAMGKPFEFGSGSYQLTVRAGVAMAPADGKGAESLFRNAEAALNGAKKQQQRLMFYEPQMGTEVAERLTLEGKLRHALHNHEFVLHYQPKFDAHTREISGLEALIRWADPDDGLISPGKFIPLLEETGMILQVGRWALEQASEDYLRWQHEGLEPPRVAVNVSAVQLQNEAFLQTLGDIVTAASARGAIEGAGLDLEITESLLMEDIEGHIRKLERVRKLGMKVSIDDFGTGYSSLGYLARLPIDALKIDRTFVSNMTEEPHDLTIVSTIISLAHAMHLSVVAEGVETEEQAKFLKLLKCNELQGFLLGKPATADKISDALRRATSLKKGDPTLA